MPRNLYPERPANGKLGAMTAKRSRGFSLLELVIVVAILGAVGIGGLLFASNYFESWSKPFDSEGAARKWAQDLQYSLIAASCTNSPTGGNVRCTVRVTEQKEPIPLECGVVSKKCSIMKVHGP